MDDQDENQIQEIQARERAKQKVKSFVRKMQFESYVRSGLSPSDAAVRVGIKIRPGSVLKAQEVIKIIERGRLGKRI
jgi:hypothetical protein